MEQLFRLLWLELRSVQSVVLIKWLQYRSCVIRALLCCDGRVGRRSDPFDWWVLKSRALFSALTSSFCFHFAPFSTSVRL